MKTLASSRWRLSCLLRVLAGGWSEHGSGVLDPRYTVETYIVLESSLYIYNSTTMVIHFACSLSRFTVSLSSLSSLPSQHQRFDRRYEDVFLRSSPTGPGERLTIHVQLCAQVVNDKRS